MFAMKNCYILLLLLLPLILRGSILVMANPIPDSCELPNCRRPGSSTPGSLKPNEVPQMVVLTFEDGVSTENLKYLNQFFGEKFQNPNSCPMHYTFFATDRDNDYKVSSHLATLGHELASHSLTHTSQSNFWSNISAEDYEQEMVGMKTKLEQLSGAKVSGARSPFLELNGDSSYKALKKNGFVWDSSMLVGSPKIKDDELPIWPFTLDKPVSENVCVYSKCPESSYPGTWEFPMNRIYNKQGDACSLVDDCYIPGNSEAILDFFRHNFYNHYYTKNRAPFGIFLHISWLRYSPILEATKSFLEEIAKLNDVYVVTVSEAIDWVKNPTPLSQISTLSSWNCN